MTWLEVAIVDEHYGITTDGRGKATREFYVEADTEISSFDCLTANDGTTAVTLWGQAFDPVKTPFCRANDVDSKWISPRQRRVIVQFEDPTLTIFDTPENMLAKPAVITVNFDTINEEYTKDWDSPPKYVRNTAGEPFDRGPEHMLALKVFTIVKFVTGATLTAIESDIFTNNPNTVLILGRGYIADTLLLSGVAEQPVGDIYQATITVRAKWHLWKDNLLNVGFSELSSGQRKDITQKDASGKDVRISKPWPLNADGSKKSAPDATPDILTFWPYARGTWTSIPFT